jgi:hypothetical protein
MSELVDLYNAEGVRVWLRLDDDCRGDLDIRRIRGPHLGTPPEWFTEECSESRLESVIHPQWRPDGGTWATWALEHGLCPGQPFLVEIDAPRLYRCSYEYDEWDVEWTWDLLDVVPRSPERAARIWADFYVRRREILEAQRQDAADRRLKSETDRAAMFISTGVYWHSRYYDECSPPDGEIVRLLSKHGALHIEGRAHGERAQERAWDDLVRRAVLRLPHLTPQFIRELPRRW